MHVSFRALAVKFMEVLILAQTKKEPVSPVHVHDYQNVLAVRVHHCCAQLECSLRPTLRTQSPQRTLTQMSL